MAKNHSDETGFTFNWSIENITYCVKKKGECLESPIFFVESLERTHWYLKLYPNARLNEQKVSIFLSREVYTSPNINEKSKDISISFELSMHAEVINALDPRFPGFGTFLKDCKQARGRITNTTPSEFFSKYKHALIRCRMWKDDSTKTGSCSAKSRISVERNFTTWAIEDFSSLQPSQEQNFHVAPISERHSAFNLKLFLSFFTVDDERLKIEITAENIQKHLLTTCKISVLDSNGKEAECVRGEHMFENGESWYFSSLVSKKKLLSSKHAYLPDDALYLRCEFVHWLGDIVHEIDDLGVFPVSPRTIESKDEYRSDSKSIAAASVLKEDLQRLLNVEILSDVVLRVGDETFPAHRLILSARSPVFKAMFTKDMKEKSDGCVDILDLDSGTVRKLLGFLYTDVLDDLEWESVMKLYFAAQKYIIPILTLECSSYLKSSLSSSNACKVLELADLHHDSDLKTTVENFILKHDDEIFGSKEWSALMCNNTLLAATTM